MNLSKLLYYSMTMIVGFFFVIIGMVGLLALWFPHIQTYLVVLMLENAVMISIFASALLVIGIAIIIHVIQNAKHTHYCIKAGKHLITVDENLIDNYLQSYWKELFPKRNVPSRVALKNNKISIIADLPYYPHEEQKILLGKIDKDVTNILAKIFGYNQEFSLLISFNETNQPS